MTQGYGPDHGQQGQWGPGGQNPPPPAPQWGQPEQPAPAPQPQWGQPSPSQWGQASPAAGPAGYPGAAGQYGMGTGPQLGAGDGVNWKRVKLIGLILLISAAVLLLLRLGINLSTFIGADDLAASDAGGEIGAAGVGSSLANLVLYGLNFLVNLIVLGLGIAAAVMGRGRARVGGIIAAVAIPLSAVLFWVFVFLAGIIMGIAGVIDDQSTTAIYYVTAGAGVVHALVIVAIIAVGSFFVFSTASKKLSV
ncbi:hypothetical protein [Brachybacterium avium]|uniref:hypothetical protein n=1 Tax=Brachybacterium avium TaxID=2017485 RepID=UPI0015AC9649|nr:hypothetical protein [Brachybacterium avium]